MTRGWPCRTVVATCLALASVAADARPPTAPVPSPAATEPVPSPAATERLIADSRAAMPIDPAKARRLASAAGRALAAQPPAAAREIDLATAGWLAGEAAIRLNDLAGAQPIIAAALQSVARIAPGSKLHGSLLASRAGIEGALGQRLDALNDYQRAYGIFQKLGLARDQAIALQNIGSIYQDAADYRRVLYYYRLANETYPNDAILALSSSNNQANALDQLGQYAAAETEYRRALAAAKQLASPLAEARILDNLAQAQIKQGQLRAAAATLRRGLVVTRATDAAGWYPLLLGTAARLAVADGRAPQALGLLRRAFAAAGAAAATARFRDLHYTAYLAHKQSGDAARALGHFEIYRRHDDEGRSLAASTNATLAAARFDFAAQNARIATLKTGQLRRDIALTRLEARQSAIILGALLTLVTVIAVALGLYLASLRRSRDAIGKVNARLVEVNAELEAALRAKTQFLATTSHEIRTPLNGVLGMAQVLLADPSVTGGTRERIGLMLKAGGTMRALVDDLLDSAKTDASSFEIAREYGNLHELLTESVAFWAADAQAAGLRLILERRDCPQFIVEDLRRLRQIISNIVANAIKFTAEGSVTVTATAPLIDGREFLSVVVADTGIGIAAGETANIFERFVQLDGSTTRQFGGTGLGLAICRNLARSLGGDVLVTSEPGVGSRFTILLPFRRGAVLSIVPRRETTRATTLADANLLVVGANPLVQGMLSAVFQPLVAGLAFAATLEDAGGAVAAARTDLVLLEGTALAAEGAAGLARLREFADTMGDVLLAALWPADATDPQAGAVIAAGVDCLIAKPIPADRLVARLRVAIALRAPAPGSAVLESVA